MSVNKIVKMMLVVLYIMLLVIGIFFLEKVVDVSISTNIKIALVIINCILLIATLSYFGQKAINRFNISTKGSMAASILAATISISLLIYSGRIIYKILLLKTEYENLYYYEKCVGEKVNNPIKYYYNMLHDGQSMEDVQELIKCYDKLSKNDNSLIIIYYYDIERAGYADLTLVFDENKKLISKSSSAYVE